MTEIIAKSHYECFVTEVRVYRDHAHYLTTTENSWIEEAESVEELKKKLSKIKVRETKDKASVKEHTTIHFEKIREILVISEIEVDDNRLTET